MLLIRDRSKPFGFGVTMLSRKLKCALFVLFIQLCRYSRAELKISEKLKNKSVNFPLNWISSSLGTCMYAWLNGHYLHF